MAKKPWYPFYWADYAGDTAHLSMVEHGAYKLLMQHYYLKAAPLPANADLLHRVCRCSDDTERAAVQSVLSEFFIEVDGVYRHTRIDAELEKSKRISKVRAEAAQSRHANAGTNARANAGATADQKHTQSQSQSQEELPPITPPAISADGFDDFWSAYAKKVDRPAAERAWKRAKIQPVLLPVVLEAAHAYSAATPNKQYRKNPATWLNNRGWENEVIPNEEGERSGKQGAAGQFFDDLKDYASRGQGAE